MQQQLCRKVKDMRVDRRERNENLTGSSLIVRSLFPSFSPFNSAFASESVRLVATDILLGGSAIMISVAAPLSQSAWFSISSNACGIVWMNLSSCSAGDDSDRRLFIWLHSSMLSRNSEFLVLQTYSSSFEHFDFVVSMEPEWFISFDRQILPLFSCRGLS